MDERLVSMYRRFTWRILSNYVTPWEFEQLKAEITDYEQWCAAWSRHAARHLERGDAALAAGRRLTAGDAYLRGALAYHWASFVFTHDQAQFRGALGAMGAAWAKATAGMIPEVTEAITAKTAPRADREKVMYDSEPLAAKVMSARVDIPPGQDRCQRGGSKANYQPISDPSIRWQTQHRHHR